MPLPYNQNKKHIYKWRLNNPGKYRETCRVHQKRYDDWKAIQKVFLRILI